MANSAFDHEPTLTLPVSSTNTALVTWTGTGADTLGNSTILVGATTMGLAADTDLLTFGNGTIAITGAVTGVTALTVDNLNINGNTFTATSGAVNITPAAGSAIVLDGAVNVDAGVVTGATSITSTEFVGGGVGITALAAANITASGTLPVLNGSNLTALTSANLTGALPAISGANLTNLPAGGATINNATANELVTVASTTTQLDAEANLTYDGAELKVSGSGAKLVLDQDSGDAYIFELRSTDVTTGLSRGTNVYGQFMKKHTTSGMLQIWGFSDSNANQAIGMSLAGISGIAANATKSTGAIGIVEINTGVISSGSIINPAANGNMVVIRDAASGNSKFIFDEDGDGHADSSWTTYSDNRLKFNQEVIPYGLDTLMQLQPKVYDRDSGYLEDGVPVLEGKRNRQIGFIAQEVKALIPEVIKDIDDEATSWYSLDDGKLVAVLVKAVQELNAKVDALTE
jgi:hypothetical protein